MNLDFFVVISNLMSLFALITVGFIAVRSGVLDSRASSYFSALLLKVTLPCTIFVSLVQKDYDPAFIHDSIIIMTAGLIIFTGLTYVSHYVAIFLGVPREYRGVWAFAATFSNSGFMGFPVALALFGAEGLALSVMLNMTFNISIYTAGIVVLVRDNQKRDGEKLNVKGLIINGINISVVLSFIFYFGQIKVPQSVMTPLAYISNITTPLSMMIIGIILADSNAKEILTDKHAWSCSFVSLVLYPVLLAFVLKFLPLSANPLVSAVLILILAMPAASITMVLSETYHADTNFAAKVLFIQNLFCIVTIPLICMLIS